MQNVSERYQTSAHPIRILQFGEGNFLRTFADYAIDAANEERNFDAGIAIVMPRAGKSDRFSKQHNIYYGMPAGTAGWGSVYGKPGHYFGSDRTQRPR